MNNKIGIDGVKFQVQMKNSKICSMLDGYSLIGSQGKPFGRIKAERGNKVSIEICLPKYIRDNNIEPFSHKDYLVLENIFNCLEDQLKPLIGDLNKCFLRSIECNITLKVMEECTCSQVIQLFNVCFTDTVNVIFEGASPECKYKKEKQSIKINKKNYYALKIYNKSLESKRYGIIENEELLRIEIVMSDRIIKRLFGVLPTLQSVLSKQALNLVIDEYKRIFCNAVKDCIEPSLNGIYKTLQESLFETNKTAETVMNEKEIIVDQEILREVLIHWYFERGFSQTRAIRNASSAICRLDKCNLPQNVIKTIDMFGQLCNCPKICYKNGNN